MVPSRRRQRPARSCEHPAAKLRRKRLRRMIHKLSLSIALASVCALAGTATAQTASPGVTTASGTQAELASYGQNYASASPTGGTPQAMAFGQSWGGAASNRDNARFLHYPYVFYPQNFRGSEYYRSSDSLYHRYPPEMQIPVYNKQWHNYYPSSRRYHSGHHFILDVF